MRIIKSDILPSTACYIGWRCLSSSFTTFHLCISWWQIGLNKHMLIILIFIFFQLEYFVYRRTDLNLNVCGALINLSHSVLKWLSKSLLFHWNKCIIITPLWRYILGVCITSNLSQKSQKLSKGWKCIPDIQYPAERKFELLVSYNFLIRYSSTVCR